uniref:UDP-glucose 4-epimerase n=1 Tax=Rhabditophanes sp. KR3021 TaxID=114890 RepID=A0AC35U8V9_9BILA
MKILVSGGAGFIGSHTVLELLNADYDVVCVDNFANAIEDDMEKAVCIKRIEELTGKVVTFVKCDLKDIKRLGQIFVEHKFDAIIHVAALKSVAESVREPLMYYQNNLIGTLNLLSLCADHGIKNFVFSSSATVYGNPEFLPITEQTQTGVGVTNPYGQSKCMNEQMLRDLVISDNSWNIIVLRYFNAVGAHPSGRIGEDPKGIPNNLMPYIAQVAVGKLPYLNVYGTDYNTNDGTSLRDYIHIVDLAKGHVAALDRMDREKNVGYEVYNLGIGKGHSVLEMVKGMEKACGHEIPIKTSPPRPGDVGEVYCDPSLAIQKLGWKTELGVDDMCRDMWNWQFNNPNGYQ